MIVWRIADSDFGYFASVETSSKPTLTIPSVVQRSTFNSNYCKESRNSSYVVRNVSVWIVYQSLRSRIPNSLQHDPWRTEEQRKRTTIRICCRFQKTMCPGNSDILKYPEPYGAYVVRQSLSVGETVSSANRGKSDITLYDSRYIYNDYAAI